MIPTINSDAILVRLAYSSKVGETATFKIEPQAWEMLKANEGKNYALVLAEVGNDGMPTKTEPKQSRGWQVGERSKWVIERCKDEQFWRFLLQTFGTALDEPINNATDCKAFLLHVYKMTSRKEFDGRANDFDDLRNRYRDWYCENV